MLENNRSAIFEATIHFACYCIMSTTIGNIESNNVSNCKLKPDLCNCVKNEAIISTASPQYAVKVQNVEDLHIIFDDTKDVRIWFCCFVTTIFQAKVYIFGYLDSLILIPMICRHNLTWVDLLKIQRACILHPSIFWYNVKVGIYAPITVGENMSL